MENDVMLGGMSGKRRRRRPRTGRLDAPTNIQRHSTTMILILRMLHSTAHNIIKSTYNAYLVDALRLLLLARVDVVEDAPLLPGHDHVLVAIPALLRRDERVTRRVDDLRHQVPVGDVGGRGRRQVQG